MFELFVLFQLISACTSLNPCVDFLLMSTNGLRSSDFDSRSSKVSICDTHLESETWYRFDDDAGTRLIERPVDPWLCGTQAPIWINGSHPTDMAEVAVKACAIYSSTNICGWSGSVRIRLCNVSGSQYFVYQLAVPPGCPLAYCIDAASRKQCVLPLTWLQEEFKCGVSVTTTPYSPIPQTSMKASVPTSSPSTKRSGSTTTFSTSSEPTSSGWSAWGPWSVCSKPCDYGYQSSRRTCSQLPCVGPGNTYRLCNDYNCQKLQEEKTRGIVLVLQDKNSVEDTMLTAVKNQTRIHEIILSNINSICSQNVSLCCGWQYAGISPFIQEFVTSGDIYPSQGRLELRPDNTVSYQLIAVINEDIDKAICKGRSQRRLLELNPNFVSFDVMSTACYGSTSTIFRETGLIVNGCIYPSKVVENNGGNKDNGSCPLSTCVVPAVVVCITLAIVAVVIAGIYIAKKGQKPDTATSEPEFMSNIPEIHHEPGYEDLFWQNIHGTPEAIKKQKKRQKRLEGEMRLVTQIPKGPSIFINSTLPNKTMEHSHTLVELQFSKLSLGSS